MLGLTIPETIDSKKYYHYLCWNIIIYKQSAENGLLIVNRKLDGLIAAPLNKGHLATRLAHFET